MMIPKKIHYCWFGKGKKPKLAQKCIASWKKCCPDFDIFEWNESNFDVNLNGYTKYCYENKKYAFLSDYVRLLVVYREGGIYFDTDVEVLKSIEPLLNNSAYFGFEEKNFINTGLGFGAEAQNSAVAKMIDEYNDLLDGKHGVIGCPKLNTDALLSCGLKLNGETQYLPDATVYSADYFNPYSAPTGVLKKTKNTYTVHWYMGSCLTTAQKFRGWIGRPLHRILGNDFIRRLKK